MPAAMKVFFDDLNVAPIDREMMGNSSDDNEEVSAQRVQEMQDWFMYEIRQYTSSDIAIKDLKPYTDRITLLNGTDSRNSFPQEVNEYLAKELGLKIVEIPGGHLGYVQNQKASRKSC